MNVTSTEYLIMGGDWNIIQDIKKANQAVREKLN